MALQLNVVLAKTDQGAGPFKAIQEDYLRMFKDNDAAFKGVRKTYDPAPGTMDNPSMRENKQVVATVKEKLDWFTDFVKDHVNGLLSVEATNATGKTKANLTVDGVNFGMLSALELMRLKSIVDSGTFLNMYANLPVRNDAEIWNPSKNDQYIKREVFETELREGPSNTTDKRSYILEDPNIGKLTGGQYSPVRAEETTVRVVGNYTQQFFSGQYTSLQRAEILSRRHRLLVALTEALKVANQADAVESQLKAESLLSWLHYGSAK